MLTSSARRCALCYGVDNDFNEKKGQIAHLDKDHSNHSIANLVFLCLDHHDSYDGRTSQSKGYRRSEVIHYRQLLYERVAQRGERDQRFENETTRQEERYEDVASIENRYYSLEGSLEVLEQQIMARARAVGEYIRRMHDWLDDHLNGSLSDDEWERQHEWQANWLRTSLNIPTGVYGLGSDGRLSDSWINDVEDLVSLWVSGEATYDECTDLIIVLDSQYDLDLHWILYGIPNSELPRLAYFLLHNFVYVFGLRGQSEHRANKQQPTD